MNSPSTSLAFLYPNSHASDVNHAANRSRQQHATLPTSQASPAFTDSTRPSPTTIYADSPQRQYGESSSQPSRGRGLDIGNSYGHNLLGWGNYPNSDPTCAQNKPTSSQIGRYGSSMNSQAFPSPPPHPNLYPNSSQDSHYSQTCSGTVPSIGTPASGGASEVSHFGNMTIESQDIDMSALGNDMMPWLEYLPQTLLNGFDVGDANIANGQPG